MPGTHTPTVSPSITDHTKKGTSSSVLLRLDTGVSWPLESPLSLHHQKSLAIKPGVSMYRYLCPAKEKADVKYWLVDPNSVTQQSDIRYLPAPLHSFWSLIFQTLRQRTLLFSYWKMCPIAIHYEGHPNRFKQHAIPGTQSWISSWPLCFCKGQTCPEPFVNCQNADLTTM